jgi:RNA polymerase sigma factor (sigma-70 family)
MELPGRFALKQAFAELMERVQAGDQDAARQLYDEYGAHLVRAVRRRLHQNLRSKFDSLDFAQDVWASFFADDAQRYELHTPEQLVGLLTAMARNKVAEVARDRFRRQARNINREHALQEDAADRLPGTQPTPSQVLMGEEAWSSILAQARPVHRRILLLLREGKPPATIAQELGISSKTVQRVIRQAIL